MTKCPCCGFEIEQPKKEWNLIPHDAARQAIRVRHYVCHECQRTKCQKCRHYFRIADKIERPK
jgi:hypothetical protein